MRDYLIKLFGNKFRVRWAWFNLSVVSLSVIWWGFVYLYTKLTFDPQYAIISLISVIGAFILAAFFDSKSLFERGIKIAYATAFLPGFLVMMAVSSLLGGIVYLNTGIYTGSKFVFNKIFGVPATGNTSQDIAVIQDQTSDMIITKDP